MKWNEIVYENTPNAHKDRIEEEDEIQVKLTLMWIMTQQQMKESETFNLRSFGYYSKIKA